MRRHTGIVALAVAPLGLLGCGGAGAGASADGDAMAADSATPASAAMSSDTAWITLFDGTDLSAWRGYHRSDVPTGWQVRDGLLVLIPGSDGGDLITRDEYGDFELALDWRVAPGGNSGIFYRASEDPEVIWYGAPELQLLDNAGHPDGGNTLTSAGAAYDLYPPTADVAKPGGEWNATRIVGRGPHVEHWLNGTKIVEYEAWSQDWNARVAASKFAEYPGFGEARSGHIGVQDHGDTVWFRDIRVRTLPPGDH